MEDFGPLSELMEELTPEDREEVARIKAEMQREGKRRSAARQAGRRVSPLAGRESGNTPASAVAGRPAGALKDSAETGR